MKAGLLSGRKRVRPTRIVIFASTLVFGYGVPASAVTVEDFDNASEEQRSNYVAATIRAVYQHYVNKGEDAKSSCMERLYSTTNSSGDPRLFTLILDEIDLARSKDPTAYDVADIIYGVIDVTCEE